MKEGAVMWDGLFLFKQKFGMLANMAGDRGFEPLLTDSESAVLPLD